MEELMEMYDADCADQVGQTGPTHGTGLQELMEMLNEDADEVAYEIHANGNDIEIVHQLFSSRPKQM